jgi:hypothetical protein
MVGFKLTVTYGANCIAVNQYTARDVAEGKFNYAIGTALAGGDEVPSRIELIGFDNGGAEIDLHSWTAPKFCAAYAAIAYLEDDSDECD